MRKVLLTAMTLLIGSSLFAQQKDCFTLYEAAFKARGSYTVADDMHRKVIICFFTADGVNCVNGKVRVENGAIVNLFLQYDDDTYELYEKKFTNAKKMGPVIVNGISEMATSADGEKFRVVFIEKLKPKAKTLKPAEIPKDL
jgi:hypothetical protein